MPAGSYRETVARPGVQPFLWTQFLGAFNDNVFKMVVSLLAVRLAGEAAASRSLSLISAVFILPFFLFSGYAGHLADVSSKRSVLVWTKGLEVAAMALAVPALMSGRVSWLLVVLFLMAAQATFFSPAKYGIVPEMLPDHELSRANGLLEMSTFLAIILGTSLGGLMFAAWHPQLAFVGLTLFALAVAGTFASLRIPVVPAAQPRKAFSLNPWGEIGRGVARLYADRNLWMTTIGISYFWCLGALLQLLVILFGTEVLRLDDFRVGILGTFLAGGIGIGSLAAGRLSGDKVELGLVPIGSIGMGVFSIWLSTVAPSYPAACAALALLGFSGGLFVVPLNALLQQKSGSDEKGRVLATNNFLNTVGVLIASGLLWSIRDLAHLSVERAIFICGVFTLIANVYVLAILPDFLIRFTLWLLTHTIYRIRIVGQEHVPVRGPALLVCNHISLVDGFLVGACVQRFIRFMVWRPYYEARGLHWLMKRMHAIPVAGGSRRQVLESLDRARQALVDGHVVCIFAEGAITRTGNLLPFKRGFEHIVKGLNVPVIPVCIDRIWGSVFSFKNGRFFWKWPERLPYPVTVSFGRPLPSSVTAPEARLAIAELASDALGVRRKHESLLHVEFMRSAKRGWFRFCMADSTGQQLSRGRALTAALILARAIARRCRGEEMIGVMLPPSVGGALVNVAALTAGKIPVNLNFTAGPDAIGEAIRQCDIKTIFTSRRFLSKISIEPGEDMVFLEDLLGGVSRVAKLSALVQAALLPTFLLRRLSDRGTRQTADSLATVIFSSGSTGVPKGVMLSHRNVLANIDSMSQVFWVTPQDRMIGVLPFFHSFGFTGTLWFPLLRQFGVAYHMNPMDAKTIGELTAAHRGTLLISTPTFCGAYTRKCTAAQFATLRIAIVGAEKLREPIAASFREKFSVSLLEGYGCTEMSPVVSVNSPDVEDAGMRQQGWKSGTVGQPVPGVVAKIVDPDTGDGPLFEKTGLLLVKGPNLMLGYLGQPEKTAEAMREGWYITGDIAMIDEDGFIHITDRLSRFSKIGGEMVPHIKIEETINAVLGEACSVVTAVPDAARGESLIAFYTRPDVEPDALWARLNETALPRLWLPRRENLRPIDAIPTLGTGKVDLRKVKALALEGSAQIAAQA
jgi:acyl-[acyl-carrier-protein]-phospholipid O-acyltransferase / long-chain-fatty-acid--[acyl-carrier-protein] ligase